MNPPWREALAARLEQHFGARLAGLQLLAGGASKESWALEVESPEGRRDLILRRAGGGAMQSEQLSLEQEFQVIRAARAQGVTAPEPLLYLADLGGREAFVSVRLQGESVGRRIVTKPEFVAARAKLPARMAEELARIHAVPVDGLGFLPGSSAHTGARHNLERLRRELDGVSEPHPVIELALSWLAQHEPAPQGRVLVHGDFRIGNLMIDTNDLIGVLDWEFAHLGDPAEDLAWPLVRAWRFGRDDQHLGGIGDLEPFLERYNSLTNRSITLETLFYWEVMGNAKWAIGALAQAKRHLTGEERNVELAVLGRLSAEMELELLHLLES